MNNTRKLSVNNICISTALNEEMLCGISFVIFFAQDVFRVVVSKAMPFLSNSQVRSVVILLMYTPLLFILLSRKSVSLSGPISLFLYSLALTVLVFGVTYVLHPEYHEWFFARNYPIISHIFKPDKAVYSMLFLGVVGNPKHILKWLKVAAWLLFAYYSYRFIGAQIRGYWITAAATAAGMKADSYDLTFGYDCLLVYAFFLVSAAREKKLLYYIVAGIMIIEILLGGSRGALIGVAVLVLILFLKYRKQIPIWIRIIVLSLTVFVFGVLLFLGTKGLLRMFSQVAGQVFGADSSSRTVQSLVSGEEILDDNGRERIYRDALNMIQNGFWGYGAYGDRYVIGRWLWAGYCHNIFLELLIDFGWILGGLLCITIIAGTLKMLTACRDEDWWDCFVIFLIPSFKLLLSGSFWFTETAWAAMMVCLMYKRAVRKRSVS